MLPAAGGVSCSYELDERFRIVSVDPGWTAFACENGAPELAEPGPIGRPIWDYISDATTAAMWRQIFGKVLSSGVPMVVPIRCDSPTLRRFLELVVAPAPGSGLRVSSTVVRVEERLEVPLPVAASPREALLRMCSWCQRVLADGQWIEPEQLVTRLRLFESGALPDITHGMCPDCHREVNDLVGDQG
jgi:hypothetical protein